MSQKDFSRNEWIKPKVIGGFLLVVLFSTTAIFITYKGISDLKETREGFGVPGQKISVLNKLITAIYNEDSDFRIFVLTADSTYLKEYKVNQRRVGSALQSLKKLSYNSSSQLKSIRKIGVLIENKRSIESEILNLRAELGQKNFYDRAIQKIARAGEETQRYAQVARSKTITRIQRDTIIEKKDKNPSMTSRIKRFFLGPDKIDTVKLDTLVEYRYDTITPLSLVSDSIINKLTLELRNIRYDQLHQKRMLDEKEKELLERNKAILSQIQLIISSIERQEQVEANLKSLSIQDVLNRSLLKVLLLGTITFIAMVILLAIIMRDISRNTLYNTYLLEAKQYAESLLRLKEQFLANMSHEIRSPLSAIIGITRQLSKTELNPRQQDYVGILQNSSDHLLSVINDILDYSKLETGKLRLEQRVFSPRKVVENVVKLFEAKATEKELNILVNVDASIPEKMVGDDYRLQQVLINLVGNSIKFTNQGSIIVSASVLNQADDVAKIQFTVADTGIGIPVDKQAQIFEEFTQADSSTSRRFGGTGLGLTIVKRLVELQGGEVSLSSQPDEGTIIRIVIPYSTKVDEAEHSENRVAGSLKEGAAILIIDDDEVNRLIVTEMAKSIGLKVTALESANKLLEIIKVQNFDAILTDIHMPEISGYDVVSQLEENGVKVPVIGITANDTIDNPEHFSTYGFSGYLIKPFTEDDLVRVLGPIVGYSRSKRRTSTTPKKVANTFDLDELYRFTGGNKESVRLILNSFLENTQKNMGDLAQLIKNRELTKASNVAHKMKSAFNQFKIYDIASILQKIEHLPPNKYKAASLYLERLNRRMKGFIVELKQIIERL
ncbi:ATP-binding protein [Tenuifilum thalassicum]|uniref:histidine kinase n=1 Tax=Tenuifilum thalassicum TaxID=2590900 RepID=A0A7D3XM40_9BACT|nr:ATP-binding protein [Tenuifilum thalassicum]QKG80875.1 response regulator [Tenuifilum thalassicum]